LAGWAPGFSAVRSTNMRLSIASDRGHFAKAVLGDMVVLIGNDLAVIPEGDLLQFFELAEDKAAREEWERENADH
jgi:hypothetical protein